MTCEYRLVTQTEQQPSGDVTSVRFGAATIGEATEAAGRDVTAPVSARARKTSPRQAKPDHRERSRT